MSDTMKQTVTHDTWDEEEQTWRSVTSEVDVLTPEAQVRLEVQNEVDYIMSCSPEELAEYRALKRLAGEDISWSGPEGDAWIAMGGTKD